MIAQNLFGLADTGVVTGAVTFFRTIGGAVGTAVLGTVFNNELKSGLNALPLPSPLNQPNPQLKPLVDALHNPDVVTSPSALHQILTAIPAQFMTVLKPAVDQYIEWSKTAIADAISMVFVVGTGLAAVSIVLYYLVEERELRGAQTPEHIKEPMPEPIQTAESIAASAD
jgi:hypothetical protein